MDFETQNKIATRIWAVIVAIATIYAVIRWLAH